VAVGNEKDKTLCFGLRPASNMWPWAMAQAVKLALGYGEVVMWPLAVASQ